MSDVRSALDQGQSTPELALPEVLPYLLGRSGRLSAPQDDGPALEVWLERGRIVDASWGRLRALSALEMAAVFLPRARFTFTAGEHSPTPGFDLSLSDLWVRLAQVVSESAGLAASVPGPQAVPSVVAATARRVPNDAELARLLDRIDGRRTVAELVEGRQPLVVVRGLASLAQLGAITFESQVEPEPEPVPAAEPAPESAAPEAPPEAASVESVPEPAGTAPAPPAPAESRPAPTRRWARAGLAIALVLLVGIGAARLLQGTPGAGTSPAGTQQAAATPTEPTAALSPTPPATQPTVLSTPLAAGPSPASGPLLRYAQLFTSPPAGWPDNVTSTAYWNASGYHVEPRVPGQFVALTAPLPNTLDNVTVMARFRKIGGPPGGGYGVILRAQGTPLNGVNQDGRYYVFEVDDQGEIGVFQRDQDHWVRLFGQQDWTPSPAVQPGLSENRLEVHATGPLFTFAVVDTNNNRIQVAQVTNPALPSGAVGVFVGGDGNQVVLEEFVVTAP